MSTRPRIAILDKHGGALSWHLDLADGFREIGADALTIQLRPECWAEKRNKWRTKSTSFTNAEIVERVARALSEYRPQLVLVLKQAGLPPATLARWREAVSGSVPFVGWLCDHIATLPAGHAANLDGVYHFDSATAPVLNAAYQGGPASIAHLPLAANPARYPNRALPFAQRRPRLVFAGNHTAARRALLELYRTHGGVVDAYGPRARVGLRLWRRRHLGAARLAHLYGSYFASLNLLQAPNTINGLNLRAFEIPASGGLGTYPVVPDLASAFEPGEEIVAYHDIPDLKRQMTELLAMPERAEKIAAAGRARVLREHTFAHRARRIRADWLT